MRRRKHFVFAPFILCLCLFWFSQPTPAKNYFVTQSTNKTWCAYANRLSRDKFLGEQGIYLWANIEYEQGKIINLTATSSDSQFETFRKDSYRLIGIGNYDVVREASYPQDKFKRKYLYKFRNNKLIFRAPEAKSWEPPVPYEMSYFNNEELFRKLEKDQLVSVCSKVAR